MIITILIFIVILAILVFVHEFGHFIVAKKSGMQVDEFGFGFPPRLGGVYRSQGKWKFIWGSKNPSDVDPNKTIYSINLIPLGGFVKIVGENNEDESNPRSFANFGFWPRFFTLVAGVTMNFLLAWVLISIGYVIGLPVAVNEQSQIPQHANFTDQKTAILEVVKNLPANKAGIKPNDILLNIDGNNFAAVKDVQAYVKEHAGKEVIFEVSRKNENLKFKVTPTLNPPAGEGPTGIAISLVGKLKYPIHLAVWEGLKTTLKGLLSIVTGLYSLFTSHVGFSSLGGPVKIAKLTGEVATLGFVYLLQFSAFLSLNLAVLNILPFPALDGGRVLFLIIEKIRGKRNNQKVEQVLNTAGFVFLLLLMVVVTINDLIKK